MVSVRAMNLPMIASSSGGISTGEMVRAKTRAACSKLSRLVTGLRAKGGLSVPWKP